MTTLFMLPFWYEVAPYAILTGDRNGYNFDFKKLPFALAMKVLGIEVECVKCNRTIHPIRSRKTGPSRISDTKHWGRLFYSGTCETDHNKSCSRTKEAHQHMAAILALGGRNPFESGCVGCSRSEVTQAIWIGGPEGHWVGTCHNCFLPPQEIQP